MHEIQTEHQKLSLIKLRPLDKLMSFSTESLQFCRLMFNLQDVHHAYKPLFNIHALSQLTNYTSKNSMSVRCGLWARLSLSCRLDIFEGETYCFHI